MNDTEIQVTLARWLLSLVPILTLLALLVFLKWKAAEAGAVGMFVAALIAVFAFQTPTQTLAVAGGKGVWDAIFILYVIWPALLLYLITKRAGAFDALRRGIARFTKNELFLVLAFGWIFASFLQGIAGFGTPIAVVAPLLLAFGVRPVFAVAIPLIGHAWANMFGTLGVSWLATSRIVDLQNPDATAFQTALLLWIPNLLAGFTIAWLYGKGAAFKHAWPLVLIVSLLHGGGQLALSQWNPVLSNFIPATLVVAALYPLSRWKRYAEDADIQDRPAMQESRQKEDEQKEPIMGLWMSLLPYVALTVLTVVALVIPAIQSALSRLEVGLPFPEARTALGMTTEAEEPYSPISPLTHPGTFLLLSSLIAWLVYRARGFYSRWAEREQQQGEEQRGLLGEMLQNAVPASLSVVAFLVTSQLLAHSGQTQVLALGISEVAPASVYAFASVLIGIVGAFMTSSNTASNILFSPLHDTVAQAQPGLSQSAVIAGQSVGGATGNAVAPANIVLGTSTTGAGGKEGDVLRRTLPWTGVVALLAGALTILLRGQGGE
ncbi:L-lactate permease [Deinococcus peraridilitoris]|uniref:L-lactate permease n=1 Tax=Deinococcus peraridilitoris (strain DSM 19664 / LMG 22246 / CIP 109416 / KR-200) TaxID=937777 RepID=K9ZZC8_DEIPD|nr:L-lactate permease [Deinococcus peraridilitoris]AFZ66554.1 L-lactate permease [Deinococcus peraridilitoris DSM 19664]